jgi:predicted alpha/beta-fold hydrolase
MEMSYHFSYPKILQKPTLYAGNDKIRQFLEKHVKILEKPYKPSSLFWEGRLQTIFGLTNRISYPRRFPYTRELFTLADGGEVALDFAEVVDETSSTDKKYEMNAVYDIHSLF